MGWTEKLVKLSFPSLKQIEAFLLVSMHKRMERQLTSRVNSSRFTRMRTGSVMNLLVISNISFGRVAEIKTTYNDIKLSK